MSFLVKRICSAVTTKNIVRYASISVSPDVSLADEKIHTVVEGLKPNQEVVLQLRVTNGSNLNYASSFRYLPTSTKIDLDHQVPIGCSRYHYPDPMAHFWSLSPQPGSDGRFWSDQVERGFDCQFEVLNDDQEVVAQTHFKRILMARGVKRLPVKEGRVRGTLFLPPGNGPFLPLIKMYGGILKGNVIEDKAAMFASRGFACLAMAYFGVEGLPKTFTQ